MEFDLLSCTFEKLNSLKFNDLQKLSSRFHVNKRWAKKREIIEKLLLLRDQEIENRNSAVDAPLKEINIIENKWVDGVEAFCSNKMDKSPEYEDHNKRLTYNITQAKLNSSDRRLTFNVTKPDKEVSSSVTNFETSDTVDRRLTYNVEDQKTVLDALETCKFQISADSKTQKNLYKGLVAVEEKSCEIKENGNTVERDLSTVTSKTMISHKGPDVSNTMNNDNDNKMQRETRFLKAETHMPKEANKETENLSSKVKMLTIPHTRVLRQNRKFSAKESKENEMSKLKIGNKSIAIKKLNTLADLNKSHSPKLISHMNNLQINEKCSGIKMPKVGINGIQWKESFGEENSTSKLQCKNVTPNNGKMTTRSKSKTEDNILVQNLKTSRSIKFFSPRESHVHARKLGQYKDSSNTLDGSINHKSKIPKAKQVDSSIKTISATKMPDFSKIHAKRFEQMDSLHDYQRKKQERAKRLFGIPQPGIPSKVNKSNISGVFEFKSKINEKENCLDKLQSSSGKGFCKKNKEDREKPTRKDLLNRVGSKLDVIMNIKDQNRKHISGVRTNKRFELQMKFRKL